MIIFRRIIQSSENLFLLKASPVAHKNNWNVDFVSFVRKVSIPSPPKKPLTAYMIFCKEKRLELLKENPSLKSTEQIKQLAAKWNHLTVDMKKPYEISAREYTLMYGEEHKKFYENLTSTQKEELARLKAEKKESRRLLKLKKALRESGLPKPPIPAYGLFVRSQSKGKSEVKRPVTDFIRECAEHWRNISDGEKKEFEEQAVVDKKRYISEMEQWRKKLIAEGNENLLKEYDDMKGKNKIEVEDDLQKIISSTKKEIAPIAIKAKKGTTVPKN